MIQYLLMILAAAHFAHGDNAVSSSGGSASTSGVSAPSNAPNIKACLDQIRLEEYKKKHAPGEGQKCPGMNNPSPSKFKRVDSSKVPLSCSSGEFKEIQKALEIQVADCKKPSKDLDVVVADLRVTRDEYCLQTNQKLLKLANQSGSVADFMSKVKDEFDFYQSVSQKGDGVEDFELTGYYAPEIDGSKTPTKDFTVPIYGQPKDMVIMEDEKEKVPSASCGSDPVTGEVRKFCRKIGSGYFPYDTTREAIEVHNAMDKVASPLYYLKERSQRDDLQMEGAGSVRLPDGTIKYLNFNSANGLPNNVMSRVVHCELQCDLPGKRKCADDEQDTYGTSAGIRKFLAGKDPAYRQKMRYFDESFVFFQDDGKPPKGLHEIQLTSGVSLATDPSFIPTGMAALVNSSVKGGTCGKPTRFGLAEDGGGYIQGRHVDQYTGVGPEGRKASLNLTGKGSLFVMLPHGAGRKNDCKAK